VEGRAVIVTGPPWKRCQDLTLPSEIVSSRAELNTRSRVTKEEFPDTIAQLGRLGTLAARKGDRELAAQISRDIINFDIQNIRRRGRNTLWRARIASLLGDKQDAYELLKESLKQGQSYDYGLHREMDFEPLRDYKPFQELLKPKG
jgi:hypothetical protein